MIYRNPIAITGDPVVSYNITVWFGTQLQDHVQQYFPLPLSAIFLMKEFSVKVHTTYSFSSMPFFHMKLKICFIILLFRKMSRFFKNTVQLNHKLATSPAPSAQNVLRFSPQKEPPATTSEAPDNNTGSYP